MKHINPEQALEIMKMRPEFQVLDVRTRREFGVRRLACAMNIPVDELSRRYHELDEDAEIIVLCEHGLRSQRAALLLEDAGFEKIYNVLGGLSRWKAQTVSG
ncbi:Rhodanese domain protein [Chloroherpeton thalassium ATCC 35110]|uniref:Rhodanese domain protein n=1 Tax=Chloroherpeton thalassium (strain ATCC 35110 / GB-78) TaxID=517418 RepID=B3QU07_CHLT3|nr:rhodanese-like domain-containing protein [Chloroherpeton thalassium]ACF12805.1 Rhodanese domain protein [Chloroherpeton thalassium ATCC 35110]